MGLVTRSSTSRAEAPGIWTKTSIIGTMICGSSSRGSFHTAKAPSASDATMNRGVSLEWIQADVILPAMPYCRFSLTGGPPPWRRRTNPPGPERRSSSPALRPERISR